MMTDLEIAQSVQMRPITEIAATAGIDEAYLEQYGRYKAKVSSALLRESPRKNGKLILVTAITPTPAGEGKTTTTVGLADGLRKLGKNAVVALREPSLGPVFGLKGGAAGGGWAQVVPMEDINLHFTGDFHAIGAANNLLCAMVDNHIYQGNALGIDPKSIPLHRCVDMNDRQLRYTVDGIGGRVNGVPREDSWDITVASEVMAVFCLAESVADLKALGIAAPACADAGTVVHVAQDGQYAGHIVIADRPKPGAAKAVAALKSCGVSRVVMLTGDRAQAADAVARELGIDEVCSELLPADKVTQLERLLAEGGQGRYLAFVGDGINDAPVLARADLGVAMGAIGSDAAIEAADIVLMDDDPEKLALAMRLARKTMQIVWQNIVFALAVKAVCLLLGALGIAGMWLAIFADVGVMVLCVLNATRALSAKRL